MTNQEAKQSYFNLTRGAARQVEVSPDSIMRLESYANGNLLSNCVDCGKPIPVELTLCTDCYEIQGN